jgi:hypothetical protein
VFDGSTSSARGRIGGGAIVLALCSSWPWFPLALKQTNGNPDAIHPCGVARNALMRVL